MTESPHAEPPHGETDPRDRASPELRTVNEVVAYNLARARRSKGWTQAEAAERLQRQSGKTWTSATLGAAERTAAGSTHTRTRQFDANELVTFSLVFSQPVAYFFLPPDLDGKDVAVFTSAPVHPSRMEFAVSEFDLLECAIPLRFSAEVVDGVNRVMYKRRQFWHPGTPDVDWYRPEEVEEYGLPPEVEEEREREKREEEWEKRIYEYQKEIARKAEARLSSDEFGALMRVHSSELAKMLADEMGKRGAWGKRERRHGPPRGEDEDVPPAPDSGGGRQAFGEEPPF